MVPVVTQVQRMAQNCFKPISAVDGVKGNIQQLLDSKLEKSEDQLCMDSREATIRTELFETAASTSVDEPSKEFRANEIQAFLNNQIRKQHQLQVQMEEEYKDQEEENSNSCQAGTQQHVILVTQNGDKIILIQNPNVPEGAEASEFDSSAAAVAAALGAGDREGQLADVNSIDYRPSVEINEQEEYQIQMQHKNRQKMLMMQLDKLRDRKKTNILVPSSTQEQLNEFMNDMSAVDENSSQHEDGQWISSPIQRSSSQSRRNSELAKGASSAKCYNELHSYLGKAFNHVKLREEKVEQICKFFPTASHSFDSRCQELKEELLKLESNIGRFQDLLNTDLNCVESKMKNFVKDFHLESIMAELENEDEADLHDIPPPPPPPPKQIIIDCMATPGSSNVKLITPAEFTITPTTI